MIGQSVLLNHIIKPRPFFLVFTQHLVRFPIVRVSFVCTFDNRFILIIKSNIWFLYIIPNSSPSNYTIPSELKMEITLQKFKGEVSCKFECHFKTQKCLSVNRNKNNCLVLLSKCNKTVDLCLWSETE